MLHVYGTLGTWYNTLFTCDTSIWNASIKEYCEDYQPCYDINNNLRVTKCSCKCTVSEHHLRPSFRAEMFRVHMHKLSFLSLFCKLWWPFNIKSILTSLWLWITTNDQEMLFIIWKVLHLQHTFTAIGGTLKLRIPTILHIWFMIARMSVIIMSPLCYPKRENLYSIRRKELKHDLVTI
jgi:hypothetical protein